MGYIARGAKGFLKPVVDIPRWLNVRGLSEAGSMIGSFIKRIFVVSQPERTEAFDEALQRLGVTDAALRKRAQSFRYLALFFFVLAVIVYAYCGLHLYELNVRAGILGMIVGTIPLMLAFQYHFWLFQIKRRKLGCSLGEWFRQGLLGIGSTK